MRRGSLRLRRLHTPACQRCWRRQAPTRSKPWLTLSRINSSKLESIQPSPSWGTPSLHRPRTHAAVSYFGAGFGFKTRSNFALEIGLS